MAVQVWGGIKEQETDLTTLICLLVLCVDTHLIYQSRSRKRQDELCVMPTSSFVAIFPEWCVESSVTGRLVTLCTIPYNTQWHIVQIINAASRNTALCDWRVFLACRLPLRDIYNYTILSA
jgi:hypothetical protein